MYKIEFLDHSGAALKDADGKPLSIVISQFERDAYVGHGKDIVGNDAKPHAAVQAYMREAMKDRRVNILMSPIKD